MGKTKKDNLLAGLDVNGEERQKRFVTALTAERYLAKKAHSDPYYFIWYITGMKPALHHKIWISNIFHPDKNRLNLIGPRESAKTTIVMLSLLWAISWNAVNSGRKTPGGKVVAPQSFGLVSVSAVQAQDRLKMLRSMIENSQRFKNVFPSVQVDPTRSNNLNEFSVWNSALTRAHWESLITQTGSTLNKNPSFYAAGVSGNGFIGRRFSGILVMDDIVDESYLQERLQAKLYQDIMQTFIPCVTEEGRIINIGTRWMLMDIYERLEKNPMWYTITIPAIIHDENGVEHSYWPEYWPLSRLEKRRLEMDNDVLFMIMYLCDPSAVNRSRFRQEYLYKGLPDNLPALDDIYITTDFATSLRTSADWTVIYAIGVDKARNYYILDGLRFKEEQEDAIENLAVFADDITETYGKLSYVLIENVAFQSTYEQMIRSKFPGIPTWGITPKGDKLTRAESVVTYCRREKLFINQNIDFHDQMVSEWMNFPNHRHDDTLDAASIVFQFTRLSDVDAKVNFIQSPYFV